MPWGGMVAQEGQAMARHGPGNPALSSRPLPARPGEQTKIPGAWCDWLLRGPALLQGLQLLEEHPNLQVKPHCELGLQPMNVGVWGAPIQ